MPVQYHRPRTITAEDIRRTLNAGERLRELEAERARQARASEYEAYAVIKYQQNLLALAFFTVLVIYCLCFNLSITLLESLFAIDLAAGTRSILRIGFEGWLIASVVVGLREAFGTRFSRWSGSFTNSRVLLSSVGSAISGDGLLLFLVNLSASLIIGFGGWLLSSGDIESLLRLQTIDKNSVLLFLSSVVNQSGGGGDIPPGVLDTALPTEQLSVTIGGSLTVLVIFLIFGCVMGLVAALVGWLTVAIFWRAFFKDFMGNGVLKLANVRHTSPGKGAKALRSFLGSAVEALATTGVVACLSYLIAVIPRLW